MRHARARPRPPSRTRSSPACARRIIGGARKNEGVVSHLSSTQLALGAAGVVTVAAYGGFILVPAVGLYGRVWGKIAGGFLSLFILAALVGIRAGRGGGTAFLLVAGA